MRAYSASSQEALRARNLLKDWAGQGFLTAAQYQRMEQDTPCDLRRTNIFLRLILFLFTVIIGIAGVGLFSVLFLPHAAAKGQSICFLMFAAISYAAAEFAVSEARLYRYGIEEALAACSVGLLCAGTQAALFANRAIPSAPNGAGFLVPAAGALFSLWIWRRFGFPYAPLAAMIFVLWLPGYWTSSHAAQHTIIAALYAAGLAAVAAVRSRHRFTYRDGEYSIAEALLWLGLYLAINLPISSGNLFDHWWTGARAAAGFPSAFYWTTWVLTWCLPPVVLARGLRWKDRCVLAVGAIAATLTLITNKPYLGWERHTWDPMLLGALLIGVALGIRRWLAAGPGETRRGFTARRLSASHQEWSNFGAAALGLASPHAATLAPQPDTPGVHFGGGDSGGGGATSDF